MKYTVADFYDTRTLKEYFAQHPLPPAVECILIAQSSHPMKNKLEALTERWEAYSTEDFHAGTYCFLYDPPGEFRCKLRRYIDKMQYAMNLIIKPDEQIFYDVYEDDDVLPTEGRFHTFQQARRFMIQECVDPRSGISRVNLNDEFDTFVYRLTDDYMVSEISCLDMWQFNLDDADVKIPPCFHAGDLVKSPHWKEYALVLKDSHWNWNSVSVLLLERCGVADNPYHKSFWEKISDDECPIATDTLAAFRKMIASETKYSELLNAAAALLD